MKIQHFRQTNKAKYESAPLQDRKHGLGVSTKLKGWLDFEDLDVKAAKHSYTPNRLFEDEELIILDLEGLRNSDLKEKNYILENLFNMNIKQSEKTDYLHFSQSHVKIVIIPDNTKVDGQIKLEKHLKGDNLEHTFIHVGKNCDVDLLYLVTGEKTKDVNIATDFVQLHVQDDSRVEFVNLKNLPNSYYLHGRVHSIIQSNVKGHIATADFGGRLITNETITRLQGDNSKVFTDNLFYAEEGEEYDINGASIHNGKSSYSLLTGKGVIEKAKAMSRGLVKIEKPAFDSDGYQKADLLMLDDESRAIAIPDLEIHNDEVRCSHGSTISRLEENKIFYLQSRGLSKKQSQRKLVEGFFFPLLENIENEDTRSRIEKLLSDRINK